MNKNTKILFAIWIVLAGILLATGCGKIRTCVCWTYTSWEVVDSTTFNHMVDSVGLGIPLSTNVFHRESSVECSYWTDYGTPGTYLPEWGVIECGVIECNGE